MTVHEHSSRPYASPDGLFDLADELKSNPHALPNAKKALAHLSHRLEEMLYANDLSMPRVPSLALRIMATANDPQADVNRLAELVQSDAYLAGEVLKLINSSFFGMRQDVSSLRHAIVLLGCRQVGDIVFLVSAHLRIFNCHAFRNLMNSIWVHSVATAVASEIIAQMRGRKGDGAFMAGLLHDIGKPIILTALSGNTNYAPPEQRIDEGLAIAFLEHLHCKAGSEFGRKWGMSHTISDVIRNHHRVDEASAPLQQFVYCGNRIANHLGFGYKESPLDIQEEPIFAGLGMVSSDTLARVADAVKKHTEGLLQVR